MLTMIIADDESITAKSLEMFVKKEFPEIKVIAVATNGIELVQLTEREKPDMAIVDINMPGLSGIHAIEILKSRGIETRFIINTAYDDFAYVKQALDMKVDGYLLKPQKYEESVQAIRKVCDGIEKDRAEVQKQYKMQSLLYEVSPVLEKEIMLSVYTEKPDVNRFQTFCDVNDIHYSGGSVVTFLDIGQIKTDVQEIRTIVRETLAGVCDYLLMVNENTIMILFLVPVCVEKEESKKWIFDAAKLIYESLKVKTGIEYRIGIGNVYDSFLQMSASYRESIAMIKVEKQGTVEGEDGKDQEKLGIYVERALLYISRHFDEDISLDTVAEQIGISSYYLSRLISQETGKKFIEYLTDVRIAEAKRLAVESAFSAREIAEKVGYSNVTYFCKVFKMKTGKTISEYKREEKLKE